MTALRASLNAAVEAGTVTADTARAVLNWIGPDGRGQPPTERAAAITREVLEQIEFQPDVGAEPRPDDAEVDVTTPTPDQPPETTVAEVAKTKTNDTGRTKKKLSAAALSRAAKSWADKNPNDAAALIWHNAAAVNALIAPDALESVDGQHLALLLRTVSQRDSVHIQRQLRRPLPGVIVFADLIMPDGTTRTLSGPEAALRIAARLPALSEHDIDGEPVSVLAAARKLFSAWRSVASLPSAPETPTSVQLQNDRLPEAPPATEPQLVLPSMPQPEQSNSAPLDRHLRRHRRQQHGPWARRPIGTASLGRSPRLGSSRSPRRPSRQHTVDPARAPRRALAGRLAPQSAATAPPRRHAAYQWPRLRPNRRGLRMGTDSVAHPPDPWRPPRRNDAPPGAVASSRKR